jgi:subtilisin-like proprotein convertase family protein
LLTTGDPIPALDGVTVSGRRLNAANLLAEIGPPVPRFNMAVAPAGRTVNQGDATTYSIDLSPVAGFTGDATLTVTAAPAFDGSLVITPATVAVPGSATLAVTTTQATPVGTYALTITGQSGALTKTRTVSLRVLPFGTVEVAFPSTDTPLPIPGDDVADFDSVLHVDQAIDIQSISVDLDVTHSWIGDLRITLTSPEGTEVVLHDNTGGSGNDIHQTYTFPTQFLGEQSQGDWVLNVVDVFPADGGTLDGWTLRVLGTPSAPSFAVAAPATLSVTQGTAATATINVSSINGFTSPVALSVQAPPALASAISFFPGVVTPPGASTMTVVATCVVAPGTYPVTIVGSSGATTRTAELMVTVVPFGTDFLTYPSTDTPRPIPDGNPTGLLSTVNVAESFPIDSLTVEVDITHVFMGDVRVELISPTDQAVILHNFESGVNLHRTYTVTAFDGLDVNGEWSLRVTDFLGGFTGTLDSWTLRASGVAPPAPPAASFSFTTSGLGAAFTDTSTDTGCGGGEIVAWAWSFGDGATSTAQHPSHTYAAAGTYEVSLTVTGASGLTSTTTRSVEVRLPPSLAIDRILRNRATFEFLVDLTWANAEGTLVELYRNGLLVDIPNNDGAHRDVFRRYETSFTWKLCEQFGGVCSNEVSVVFGNAAADGAPTEATIVVKRRDGSSTSRVVPVEPLE